MQIAAAAEASHDCAAGSVHAREATGNEFVTAIGGWRTLMVLTPGVSLTWAARSMPGMHGDLACVTLHANMLSQCNRDWSS